MRLIIIIALGIMINLFSTNIEAQDINDLLPGAISGWSIPGEDKIYTPATLYDYIDGGAELYLSYGMKEVISRIYMNDVQGEIRVEIFDMVRSEDAFGVFSHTRNKNENQFGQGSQYFTGALIFWKDHYFVTITAIDENEEIRNAINSLASQIDKKISTTGNLPSVLNFLPKEGLQANSLIYFHHYIWLNSLYYIADDNFLSIDNHVQAVLANYKEGETHPVLLLIIYPDSTIAEDAQKEFVERFMDHPEGTVTQLEDNTWLGSEILGSMLACVFNAQSSEEAQDILNRVFKK